MSSQDFLNQIMVCAERLAFEDEHCLPVDKLPPGTLIRSISEMLQLGGIGELLSATHREFRRTDGLIENPAKTVSEIDDLLGHDWLIKRNMEEYASLRMYRFETCMTNRLQAEGWSKTFNPSLEYAELLASGLFSASDETLRKTQAKLASTVEGTHPLSSWKPPSCSTNPVGQDAFSQYYSLVIEDPDLKKLRLTARSSSSAQSTAQPGSGESSRHKQHGVNTVADNKGRRARSLPRPVSQQTAPSPLCRSHRKQETQRQTFRPICPIWPVT